MDDLDRAILGVLQSEGRISNVDLASRVNLSPPAVHARVKRMEDAGLIQRYVAIVSRDKLNYDMLCFIHVTLQMHQPEQVEAFRAAVQQMPEVLECHHVTGDYDYLLKIVVSNRTSLERFVMNRLTPIKGIARIHTSLVLNEIKATTQLPIPEDIE
jgi:DNA-binding Lrp family transcriptional regulator